MIRHSVCILLALFLLVGPAMAITISASDITSQSVTLSGSCPSSEMWIDLGTASGTYGYRTDNVSLNSSSYSITIVSFPLVAGTTYYARAGCEDGYSSEISFSLPAITPRPTTTYGRYFNDLMSSNLSIPAFWSGEVDLYADQFGGGDFGVAVFTSIFFALLFVVLFLRAGDVIIPFQVAGLIGGFLVPYILPEFAEIGYALMVGALIGIGYSLYRRYL